MKTPSVKKNFIMNSILTLSTFVFPLITFPYTSRVLLSAGTGRVSFALSFVAYFTMLAELGIPVYGIRACAKVRDNKAKLSKTVQELLIINMVMVFVSFVLLTLAIIFIPRIREDKILFIIVGSSIFFSALGMEWLYKALEQYTFIAIRSIAFNILAIISMFLLVHKQSDYIVYGAISIVSSSLGYILNFVYSRKYISLKITEKLDFRQHLKPVLIFFGMACAVTIYTNLDNVMLGFMTTDAEVGHYHAAIKIKTILVSIVTSLGTVLLPRVSYYIEHKMMDEFKWITKKAINFVFVFASPLMVYFIIFAKYGVLLLSGPDFIGAVIPMQILMPTLLFIGLTGLLGIQILVPLGREKMVLYSEIAGAVVDLILNAIFIPILGATGAAIGTLVAELVVLIIQLIALRKDDIKSAFKPIQYIKIIVAILAGCAGSFWVIFINVGNFFTLLISAIFFFGIYIAIMRITKEPLSLEIIDTIKRFLKGQNKEEVNE